MNGRNDHGQLRRVAFLLVPGFSMLAYAAAIEPLRVANLIAGRSLYTWSHISPDGRPVSASNGVALSPDGGLETDRTFDNVFICASDEGVAYRDKASLAWLRRQAAMGSVLGATGSGAFLLARAGLLVGRRATLHWAYAAAFAEEFPDIDLRRSLFELDGDRLTSGGGISPLDMMHALLARDHGARLANDVTEWFVHTEIRGGEMPQRSSFQARLGVSHPGLLRVLEAMDRAIEEPLSRSDLGSIADVSLRQLDRLFVKQVGVALGTYYLAVRLQRARELILRSPLSIIEIAAGCGFQSASHFSRVYRARFGVSPSGERGNALAKFRAEPV